MAVDETLEPTETPTPQAGRRQTPPGPVARGLSQALMQGAFMKFGEAFTDTGDVRKDAATRDSRLAPFMQAGANVANALQMRWHTMEYENFQSEFVEPFISKKKAMLDDYNNRHAQLDEGWVEGPDGTPVQLNIKTAEGRLQAVRMRGQLEKKFYQVNTDMDLELFNEVAKYESNPLIVERAHRIQASTAGTLNTMTNPAGTIQAEDAMSTMRAREAEAEARMVGARAQAARVKDEKPPVSYREAIQHPDIGVGGIMQWLTSSPKGLELLHGPGGATFLNAERQLAMDELMADNETLTPDSPELAAKIEKLQSQWVPAAAAKYLKWLDPQAYEMVKEQTPWFFDEEAETAQLGVVSDRISPTERKENIGKWKEAAEDHFNKYMSDPNNDPDIEAALDELDEWMRGAVYGETNEPGLLPIAAARGKGTKRYVDEIQEQVSKHIRRWWHSKKGSGIAQEENIGRAKVEEAAAGRVGGIRGLRFAKRKALLEENRKKKLLP